MNTVARSLQLALVAVFLVALSAAVARAQDSDVKKIAVDVRVEPAAHAANVRTTLTLWNPGAGPKQTLQFRVTGKAEVRSVSVGGQTATFDAKDDKRYVGLKVVSVQLPAPIGPKATTDLVVDTRLTLAPGVDGAEISPGATILLPASLWFPVVNTQFVLYGVNTAPYTVTVDTGSAEKAVSGGVLAGATFTQPLYGLPFLVTGAYDAPIAREASGIALEAWVPSGAPASERAGAERLLADAEKIAAYYTKVLGPAPQATFRIVATDDGAGYASASGVTLGRRVLNRPTTDAETFSLLADALARVWTEGAFAVRGATPGSAANRPSGVAIVHDALPRYLAVLALGDRFGAPAEAEAFDRLRVGLEQMGDVAAQVQLSLATPFDAGYFGLVAAKGPLALRILDHEVGRDALLGAVRAATTAARTSGSLTWDDLKAAIAKSAPRDVTPVFTNWFETVVQPDLIVGVPQQTGGTWTSALRNLGTGDVTVDVVAVTDSGARVTARATVPSQGFGQAVFATSEHVASVELDPDHVVPQTNYSNDARPPRPSAETLFVEAVASLQRKEYGPAEEKLRQAAAAAPTNASYKAWQARALLGLGRNADASKAANDALAIEPTPFDAASWANNVLGQIALAGGNQREAADRFSRAATYAVEASALKTARDGVIAAGAAGTPDPSVVKFFADFDRAVSAGVNTAQAEQFVDNAALPEFVRGLVTSISRKWTTQVLRVEPTGADEALVDAKFVVVASNTNSEARALARVRRVGDAWRIVGVEVLETTDAQQQP